MRLLISANNYICNDYLYILNKYPSGVNCRFATRGAAMRPYLIYSHDHRRPRLYHYLYSDPRFSIFNINKAKNMFKLDFY